jgi:hypothetical protein
MHRLHSRRFTPISAYWQCCFVPGALCRYWDCDGDTTNGCEAGPAVDPLHGTLTCVDQKLAVATCDPG